MSQPKTISFDEFITREKTRVESFRRWWETQNTRQLTQFPKEMWPGDWNEQLHLFDPGTDEAPADANTWKEIIHGLRRHIDFRTTFCTAFEQFECRGEIVDQFFQGCLVSLNSANTEGVAEFVQRLNAHQADTPPPRRKSTRSGIIPNTRSRIS